jgi:hypothetical protein
MDGPNPISVGMSVVKALRVRKPQWHSTGPAPDYGRLGLVLDTVRRHGVPALGGLLDELGDYTADLSKVAPTGLSRTDALAFWLNLYNVGALTLAGEAAATNERSVLRLPGAFTRPFTTVEGESVSLNDIEHGKIRRFGDPRIHSALVCGSASCPTLRYEPFDGDRLDAQLDDQMGSFLVGGGSLLQGDVLWLSRVFLWYGGDFVRPGRMPTFRPAGKRRVARALEPWLPGDHRSWLRSGAGRIAFQSYDWSLGCSVRKPA